MMPAAKMLDPMLGIDFHLIEPPGAPPLLVPHPSIGIVFDPFDLIPKFGANVFVNGLPRAQAGTAGLMLPHVPLGGVFVEPPTNQLEVFMGSKTVSADEEAFSYLALPVLSCQCVGFPPLPRLKRKKPKKSLGLMLPTALVLAIPAGVFVDGPPTISLMALAFRAGLAGVGAAARRARKAQRASRRWKALSQRAHRVADKACHKLKLGDVGRNRVRRAVCTVTGHPVDVATGKLFTDFTDLELPGPLPFTLERVWYSSSTYRGAFGHGWHHTYETALYVTPDLIVHRTPDGRAVPYPPLEEGEVYFHRSERATLTRSADGYALETPDQLIYHFARAPGAEDPLVASVGAKLHALYAVTSRVGYRIELGYDAAGRLVSIVDAVGRVIGFEYDAAGRIAVLTVPHPEPSNERLVVARYAYDERGNLVTMTDAMGATFQYRYDEHLLIQEVDRAGLTFYFEYDGRDERARCVRTWGDGGLYARALAYETGRTVVTDSLGFATLYEHSEGLVTRTTDAWGGVSSLRYEHEQPVETVDALGRKRTFAYDERGNLLEQDEPDGVRLTYEYDARDQALAAVNAMGGRWSWQYDEYGQMVARTDPTGATTRFEYERGLPSAVVDARGGRTALEFDGGGNLAALTSPEGLVTRFRYDLLGFPREVVGPNDEVWRRSFDACGRPSRSEEPGGEIREFSYDGEGRLLRVVAADQVVLLEYFGLGQPAARTEAGVRVSAQYDSEERARVLVNEYGATHHFERGPLGEVVSDIGFDGVRRTYAYDAAGRVTRVESADGAVTRFEYDAADRLVAAHHADGVVDRFEYRRDGALLAANNADVSLSFERDALGRLLAEAQGNHRVESRYDELGRRVQVKSSLGLEEHIEYGALGDVLAVRVCGPKPAPDGALPADRFQARFSREPRGLTRTLALPGGVESRFTADDFGQPARHELLVQDRVLRARNYAWGTGGRLLSATDAATGAAHYEHDVLGQLVATHYADGRSELRCPDVAGSVFRRQDRADRRYSVGGQLFESHDDAGERRQYAYDAQGRLVESRSSAGALNRYHWSAEGRLAAVTNPDGDSVRFVYDALGRRVAKSSRGRVTRWVWDGDVPLHEWTALEEEATPAAGNPAPEFDADEVLITWLFVPNSFSPLAKLTADRAESIVTDYLGTPMLMLNELGELTWAGSVNSWGVASVTLGQPEDLPFRWAGQYADAETHLHYNRHRYYDPEQGQYVSRDPIGLGGGGALYAYVSDPLVLSDPLGLSAAYGREATITIRYVPGMSKVEFYRKALRLKLLGDRGLLRRIPEGEATSRRNRAVADAYRDDIRDRAWMQYRHNRDFARQLAARIRRMQVDHVHELQLDGPDDAINMRMLGERTNRGVGIDQIRPQIRPLEPGTIIRIHIEVPPDWPSWFRF
jgi:RHS repeat-associated protein